MAAIDPRIDPLEVLVTRKGEDGALRINYATGVITSPADERPDWAEGLQQALTSERVKWYQDRLGVTPTDHLTGPIDFAELGWVAADPEGENHGVEGSSIELEADSETRMAILGERLGIHREGDLSHGMEDNVTGELGHVITTRGVSEATDENEVRALEKAQLDRFDDVSKSGTNEG